MCSLRAQLGSGSLTGAVRADSRFGLGGALMIIFGIEQSGITSADLAASAGALRANLAKAMKLIMVEGRMRMAARAQSLFHGSGRNVDRKGRAVHTADLLRRAKVSADVTAVGVTGHVRSRAFLLNILEGGAHQPARTVRPVKGQALRWIDRQGRQRFTRGPLTSPARTIRPMPVQRPALESLIPVARERLIEAVVKTVLDRHAGVQP